MAMKPKVALLDLGAPHAEECATHLSTLGYGLEIFKAVGGLVKNGARIGVIVVPDDGSRASWALENLRRHPEVSDIPVVGVGNDGEWREEADAWIAWPPTDACDVEGTLGRLGALRRERLLRHRERELLKTVARASQLLTGPERLEKTLGEFLTLVVEALGVTASAVILIGKGEQEAWVVATSDSGYDTPTPLEEAAQQSLRLRIDEPEPAVTLGPDGDNLLQYVLAARHPSHLPHSITFPLKAQGKLIGGLLVDIDQRDEEEQVRALETGKILSEALAGALRGSQVLRTLQEQTKRVSIASLAHEQRGRTMSRYKDFFDTSSDGVVVLDEQSRILHINRAAEIMTGYSLGWLQGKPIEQIISPEHRDGVREIVTRAVQGVPLRNFDVDVLTTSGDVLRLAVSTSSLMLDKTAAVFTFRDVTEARAIEAELVKTKEFLEKLIDSTVDAIVATDVDGLVILFNRGAEWIIGRSAEDTVAKMYLSELFTPDGYEVILRQLHSGEHGGLGRLEQSRKEVVDAEGRIVPVNLTASVIYENEQEVGMVAVMSDLREQIQIEERLAITEEKLEVSEKQALIAELAGTTAHELNQPLTSVMGYAELLLKKVDEDSPYRGALETIMREADRMAQIVRKIGKITKYETKKYVGQQKILDLERSAED